MKGLQEDMLSNKMLFSQEKNVFMLKKSVLFFCSAKVQQMSKSLQTW